MSASLMPAWLNLDSLSIIRLAALLLSLVICVYLLRIPRKSLATWFLAGVFLGASMFNAASFFEFAGPYYWQPRNIKTILVLLFMEVGPSIGLVFLLLFAYHFPRFRHAQRREFRIVFALSMFLNAGLLGLNVYNHFVLQWRVSDTSLWNVYWTVFYCVLAAQFLWAIVILLRKVARLSRHGPSPWLKSIIRPRGRDAHAARALGVILLLPLLAAVASFCMTYGAIPFAVATYFTWFGLLLFYVAFVITYLNHTADPLTLQVKVLGVTLVLILSTLGLVAASTKTAKIQKLGASGTLS